MPAKLNRTPVIFDHDGGIDDLLSLMLLLTMDHVDLLGVTITPADCYPDDALLSTLKILTLTGNGHVPVATGNIPGPNPFPPEWRAQPRVCHSMPEMLRTQEITDNVQSVAADIWIEQTLKQAESPVTVLMTGPCTNLSAVLSRQSALKAAIKEVIWMGGAIDVKGNVAMHDHNGTAEWNAYWDPSATRTLIQSGVNVCLVPLDATNALPVDRAFLIQLAQSRTPVADLAGQFWAATVTAIPSYEFTYFLWDILATSIAGLPETAFSKTSGYVNASVSTPDAGRIFRCEKSEGHKVNWIDRVDADAVRKYVVQQFSGTFDTFHAANVN